AHADRGAGTVDHARIDIAALLVEAEGVPGLGPSVAVGQHAVAWVLTGEQAREQRDEQDEGDQHPEITKTGLRIRECQASPHSERGSDSVSTASTARSGTSSAGATKCS